MDANPKTLPHIIKLPNGDELWPRAHFARKTLNVADKTVQRMRLPTTYIGNLAYVPLNESLQIIANRLKRPPQELKRPRARR